MQWFSAYFNERTRKLNTESEHYRAYVTTDEQHQYYLGQLLEFSDADLGSLICPRPLFIEQGTQDRAVYYKEAEVEFQRLHAHYAQLGLAERCVWGLFEGKHEIHGKQALFHSSTSGWNTRPPTSAIMGCASFSSSRAWETLVTDSDIPPIESGDV